MVSKKLPLDRLELSKLTQLYQSDAYELLERIIQSNLDDQLIKARLKGIEFLLDPAQRESALEETRLAARFQVALEVLKEIETGEKFLIQIDSP